ncbi:MAG: hypothetical protein QOC94_3903, partial [Actinoplanes sp.]|nr:hypothetical protein [Actinoplanes sp.]
ARATHGSPGPSGSTTPRLSRYAAPRLPRYAAPSLSAGDTPRRPARIGPCRRQALFPTHREGNTVARALPTNPSRRIQPASIHRQRSPFFDARNDITSGHRLESARNGPPVCRNSEIWSTSLVTRETIEPRRSPHERIPCRRAIARFPDAYERGPTSRRMVRQCQTPCSDRHVIAPAAAACRNAVLVDRE